MRIVLASLLAAGLAGCTAEPPKPPPVVAQAAPRPPLTMQPPVPAPICAKPPEQAAFAMAALRMQLSVTELSCDARDQFNNFTLRYRNDVAAHNKTLGGFFSRAYGRGGVAQQDQYETSQINQMSRAGTYYGTDFCRQALPMFSDVMALKNGSELENYAVSRKFDQVLAVADCAETPAAPAKTTAKAKTASK